MSHGQIFFDESQYIDDQMLEELDMIMSGHHILEPKVKRRSWYKRNEGKIWLVVLVLTLLGLYLILPYIPSILWDLSTPLTHLLGGQ